MPGDFTYVRIDKEKMPTDTFQALSAQGIVLSVDESLLRNLFLLKEMRDRGFFGESNLSQVIDGKSQLPLLTWSLLDFLSTRKLENQSLIELGSGNSTFWFAKRFKNVRSYESNEKWFQQLQNTVPENVQLNLIELQNLESAQVDLGSADWLLIDFAGKRTKFIFSMLQLGIQPSHVILDNADWYRNGAKLLIDSGYTEIPFFGFKSGQNWISCTSIFTKGLPASLAEGNFNVPENSKFLRNSWDAI
jgi:hypothetical protein